MSFYLRFLGGGLVMIAAMITSGEYSAYAKRRLSQYSGLVALLSHMEGMISRFLASGDGLWRGFENEALESTGLLSSLKEGKSLAAAFSECEGKFALTKEAKGRIGDFLAGLGRGYRSGELEMISAFRASLEKEMAEEQQSLEKSVKITRALLLGGALAFLIMII